MGSVGWRVMFKTGPEIISEMIGDACMGRDPRNTTKRGSICVGHKAWLDTVCVVKSAIFILL